MEGDIEKDSEAKSTYTDLKARRPVIHKVIDTTFLVHLKYIPIPALQTLFTV